MDKKPNQKLEKRPLYVVFVDAPNIRDRHTGELYPSHYTLRRLKIAVAHLTDRYQGKVDLIYLGRSGSCADPDSSPAAVLLRETVDRNLVPALVPIYALAESKHLAGNVVALTKRLRTPGWDCYSRVYFVADLEQASRAAQTYQACQLNSPPIPVTLLDSGETVNNWPWLKLYDWIYRHDPKWERWPSALPRLVARCRRS